MVIKRQAARYHIMGKAVVRNGAGSGMNDSSEAESKIPSGASWVSNKEIIQDKCRTQGTAEDQSALNTGMSILLHSLSGANRNCACTFANFCMYVHICSLDVSHGFPGTFLIP